MRSPHAVVLLGLNYSPEPTGIAPYTAGLAARLADSGFEVDALVAHPHYPEWAIKKGYGQWLATERSGGVRIRRHLHYVPRSPRGIRRLLSELSFGLRLISARWGSPEVVIAVSPSLFATAMATLRLRLTRSQSRLVVWVQDIYTLGLSETGEGGGLVGHLTRWVEAWTLRAADSVVVIHSRFAEYVADELGVEPKNVTVIRNWSHLPNMEPVATEDARKALGWPADVPLAVHTGNMGVKQGLENVIDAARLADERNASVHFILVGDGGERRKLQNYAQGVSRVTFQAPLSDSAYQLALSAADVFLVNEKPGVSAMAVPSKLTSYFHAGRPIVAATDSSGIAASEIVDSRSGVVVPAGDPSALLNAVLDMDSTASHSALYGRNGQEYRERILGENVAINCWLRLLESLTRKQ